MLGDKNFAEEYILGSLYQQALEAQGYTVKLKSNIGSTEVTFAALKSGQIQGYPEYDGTLLSTVAGITANPPSSAAAASETSSWAQKHGYLFTKTTPFTDSDAIAVLKSYAQKNHLSTIGDLKKLGKNVKLGAAPEFQTRNPDGLVGLKKYLRREPDLRPGQHRQLLPAAGQGHGRRRRGLHHRSTAAERQVRRPEGHEVHLRLPERRTRRRTRAPCRPRGRTFLKTINKVSALLTQKAIISLNAAVELNQQSPASVAKAFLKANHLL